MKKLLIILCYLLINSFHSIGQVSTIFTPYKPSEVDNKGKKKPYSNEFKIAYGINSIPSLRHSLNNFSSMFGSDFESRIGRTFKLEYGIWHNHKFQYFINYTFINASFRDNSINGTNKEIYKESGLGLKTRLLQINTMQIGSRYSFLNDDKNRLAVQGSIGLQTFFVPEFNTYQLEDGYIQQGGWNILSLGRREDNYAFTSSGRKVVFCIGLEYTRALTERFALFIEQNMQAAPFETVTMREFQTEYVVKSQTASFNLNNLQTNMGIKFSF